MPQVVNNVETLAAAKFRTLLHVYIYRLLHMYTD
jgi:hypothetical protein